MKIIKVYKCTYCVYKRQEYSSVLGKWVNWCVRESKDIYDLEVFPEWCPLEDFSKEKFIPIDERPNPYDCGKKR